MISAMGVEKESSRFEEIVHAGALVLAHWGLHRTKIQDVAKKANVAAGTVYLYADSKESLFDLALRYGMGQDLEPLLKGGLPYSATRRETFEWVSQVGKLNKLLPDFEEPQLFQLPLETLFGNLFDFLSEHKYAIRIVERSAHEWEELAALFFEQIRDPVVRRIGKRIAFETPELSPDEIEALARLVGGSIAFSAVHRFFEGGPPDTTEKSVYRKVVVESIVRMIERG